jgi:PAS domain S-box-containing protein
MFQLTDSRGVQRTAAGLAMLSVMALAVTAWILRDVSREQQIVARIIQHLPDSDLAVAQELSGDLRLQSGLSVLLLLNSLGTAIALIFFVRGYATSERSLRNVKVLATDILASMDAGVLTTDSDGRITSINPSGRELIGMSEHDTRRSLGEMDDDHQLLNEICREVVTNHHPIRDRDYRLLRDGHQQTLRAGCTLLKDQQGKEIGTVIHVRDVTAKDLIEQRLRRMERYMGLGALAAGLQHEIKNPLSALSLHLQLLAERFEREKVDDEIAEFVDILRTEVRRINEVLDGFRNYASLSKLGRSAVDVSALINKLVRLLRPQAELQNVRIVVDPQCKPGCEVRADSVQLEQVLLNLALNALAAMPGGGLLRFSVSRDNGWLRIDVSDTGSGIPLEIQSQVFDPYFTTRNDGTGMGLALCDKIVRQHDGTIDFRTSTAGTEFTVRLPVEEAV